ncbi:sugar phosphate isomerase/epimerase family protein [Paenibacillus pinistramenti]|uniref:sugar phosphate isomerase/epimerase family protein n=1 Tax=Paenibacillus pinistramenti TaxID=1768003 RepID=UPI0011088783|nr:sugar phosphate isomerase/epimerase family protein [Paenibacillus pinistramenti]
MRFRNKIGVIVDSFGLGLQEGLLKAKEAGADGVQIWATQGEMDPARMTAQKRAELSRSLRGLGLEISALCADFGGNGFKDPDQNGWRIEKSKRALDLALDLGCRVVTTHIGIVPEDESDPDYKVMQEACSELAVYAHLLGGYFAIETGPETAVRLKAFLDSLGTKGIAVNFDPANMVMVTGDDPVQGVRTLKDYIVHTHVKDGVRLREVNPYDVYGALDHEALGMEPGFKEVPLGEGSVDFDAYFGALQEIGYTGYLTVEREAGEQPEADIRKAVEFIKRYRGY